MKNPWIDEEISKEWLIELIRKIESGEVCEDEFRKYVKTKFK